MRGCDDYVLKEKINLVKGILKEWHHKHGRNISRRLIEVDNYLILLDKEGEITRLLYSKR